MGMDNVVVICDGGDPPGLAFWQEGLGASGWLALDAEPAGRDSYALVGVAGGAGAAIGLALQGSRRVSALALVAPRLEPLRDLSGIECPTLVVFGQDDPLGGGAGRYRGQISNCQIAFVYDAGADIAADRPAALVDLVADFLERREAFVVENRSHIINP